MSIKTIDKPIQGSAGIAKKINKGAEKMVFDILQSTQYSMPIQSTIRELVTNACDSQREKEVAIEILMGVKKVEDYYIERHGDQYEDSNFNINYYNRDHFDTMCEIHLVYEMNEGVGYCDKFSVTDYGVGIGERRLEGILELGYSTKRNTSENFGAFGLGAKAALSTGVDFYTIDTVHNGKRFKCNCYNYKTDFIIPKFNVKTGKQNPFIIFTDGTKVYYEETDSLNTTTISFGVKKHNRNKFEEAVEEQLLYFENVTFKTIDNADNGYERLIKFKAEVLHNSKNIIVSDSYYFNKPHIVLVKDENAATGINYGHIDFRELEMEQMYGSVAFKCPARQVITNDDGTETVLQEGVDVTPSREKVIWNEATKKYIKGVILAAAQEASDLVQEELKETDFLKWVDACRSVITGNSSENRILNKLARIINTDDIKPRFSPDPRIKYGPANKLFEGLDLQRPQEVNSKVEREPLKDWQGFDAKYFYKKEGKWDKYKDMYLMQPDLNDHYNRNHVCTYTIADLDDKFSNALSKAAGDADSIQKIMKEKSRIKAKRTAIIKYIEESEWFKSYDEVEVCPEWLDNCKELEAEAEEKSKFGTLSPTERRDIEKRMVAYTIRWDRLKDNRGEDPWTMEKIEPKAKDLMNSKKRIYYCTKEDEGKMRVAATLLKHIAPKFKEVYPNATSYANGNDMNSESYPIFWYEHTPVRYMNTYSGKYYDWAKPVQGWDTPQLIRVSQNKVKHITQNTNVRHIDELFLQLTDKNGYTMDKSLTSFYTAHQIDKIKDFEFMQGLGCIHPELQKDYCELLDLREDHYETSQWQYVEKHAPAIVKHMSKIFEFQKFCNECDDTELIKAKSQELFILSDIGEGCAADLELLAKYDNIVEFAEEIKPMLDELDILMNRKCNMSPEFEKELRVYLRAKSREIWDEQ